MNEHEIRNLLTRYIEKRWDRRLLVLRWLDDAGGKIAWDSLRRMCIQRWYPLSYYVLYTQLLRDGLVLTKWLYADRPDEPAAWTYTVIPDGVYPVLHAELGAFKGEIDALIEGAQ